MDTYMTYTYADPGHPDYPIDPTAYRKVGRSSVPLVNPDNPTLEEVRTLLAEIGLPDLDHNTDLYRWAGRPSKVRYHALGFDVHLGYQTLPTPALIDKGN